MAVREIQANMRESRMDELGGEGFATRTTGYPRSETSVLRGERHWVVSRATISRHRGGRCGEKTIEQRD
jgi:hypothetical protein